MAAAQQGDRVAYAALLDDVGPTVLQFVRRRVRDVDVLVIGSAKGTAPLVATAGPHSVEVRWLLVLGLYDLVFGLLAYALFDYLIED